MERSLHEVRDDTIIEGKLHLETHTHTRTRTSHALRTHTHTDTQTQTQTHTHTHISFLRFLTLTTHCQALDQKILKTK